MKISIEEILERTKNEELSYKKDIEKSNKHIEQLKEEEMRIIEQSSRFISN